MTLSSDDVGAIQQLYARYSHTLDDGDGDQFCDCFVEDGTVGGAGPSVTGRAELHRFATRLLRRRIRHVATGVYVEGDGDEATGRAYLIAYSGAPPTFLASGRYRDRIRRDNGTWRFVERQFTPDIAADSVPG